MTTPFRNVDVDSCAPVEDWHAEAIETVIDRGCPSGWRRLAAAIRRDPWRPVARTVEDIAGWGDC